MQPLTLLSESEQEIFDMVRDFALEEIAPLAAKMDQEMSMGQDLIDQFFALSLMGIEIPEVHGGLEQSFFTSVLVIEALAMADASASVMVDVQNTLVNNLFINWSSDELQEKYLPRLASDTVGAFCLSEADSGSDAFALRTTAKDMGDHYILNGSKIFITNAKEAKIFVVFANLNPEAGYKGITAFVVEEDFEGFARGAKEDKMGLRGSSTMELSFTDCKVPKMNRLGDEGIGYKIAINTLNEGRIGIAAQMVGIAQAALNHAVAYTSERQQFGKPINSFQGIQFQLADMDADLETARLLLYNAARMKEAGKPFVREAAIAKLRASEAAERITSMSLELHGGYGYSKEYPVEKLYRDAKIGKIYEGTSNMQKVTIARQLIADYKNK